MSESRKGRLVILTGPSCVGKSPLDHALGRIYPALRSRLEKLVLYNTRDARPGEIDGVDFHFRTKAEVEALQDQDGYVAIDVRGDRHALDLNDLERILSKKDALFEGNVYVAKMLISHPDLRHIERISMFLSPLSLEEIVYLKRPDRHVVLPELITDIMRRKLLRRTRKQKSELSLKDLEEIENRASKAYREMQDAHRFDYILPNHDGEDSDNWDAFYYPLGDARKTLTAFVDIIEGRTSQRAERWDADILE